MPSSAEEDDVVVVSSDTEATPAKKKPRGRKKNVDGDEAAVPASNEKWWAKKMDVLEEPDTSDEDLDVESRVFPEREPPATLVPTLLPFQKESLYWMCEQEFSGFHGGILADEMGMGKTVQAIALILANRDGEGAAVDRGPRSYSSEGTSKFQFLASKESTKAAKLAAREAVKAEKLAAKEAEKAAKLAAKEAEKALKAAAKSQAAASSRKGAGKGKGSGSKADVVEGTEVDDDVKEEVETDAPSATPSATTQPLPVVAEAAPEVPWEPLINPETVFDKLAKAGSSRTTLVVCPVVALMQWKSEILRHTTPGALSVYVYHGASRTSSLAELLSYDVVLTTYSILESEFRKMVEPSKVVCEWCAKKFLPEKLRIHLRYFCGPDAMKTVAQAKQERSRGGSGGRDRGAGSASFGSRMLAGSSSRADSDEESEFEGGSDTTSSSSDAEESSGDDESTPPARRNVGKRGAGASKTATSSTVKSSKGSSGGGGGGGGGDGNGATWSAASRRASRTSASPAAKRKSTPSGSGSGNKGKPVPTSGAKRPRGTSSSPTGKAAASGGASARSSTTSSSGKGKGKKGAPPPQSKRARRGDSASSSESESESSSSETSSFSEAPTSSSGLSSEGDSDASTGSDMKPRRARAPSTAKSTHAPAAAKRLGPISLLQQVHWMRIILDEAHAIKNKRCTTAKAVFALTGDYRWCLSGTPLQNRVGEMFSLVRFLRVAPYAKYFCKNCPCSSLDYRFHEDGRACELCGHSPLRHYNWLNRYVLNPIKQYGYSGPGRDAMITLRKEVLGGMLLRRTKAGRAADLALPGRQIVVREDLELDAYENDFYEALYTQSKAKFSTYVEGGTLLNNYAHIFDLLTRLRQAVDHPYLILYGSESSPGMVDSTGGMSSAASTSTAAAAAGVCGICRESVEDAVLTGCRHVFCRLCMREYLESIGGSALSVLKDKTNDETAFIGSDAHHHHHHHDDDDEEEGVKATASASGSGKKKKGSSSSAKGSKSGAGAGVGAGVMAGAPSCPTCFAPLTVDLTSPADVAAPVVGRRKTILTRIDGARVGSGFRSSTKIEALLHDLWRAQKEEPGFKAIVFSQFVNMLDLINHRLSHAGVRCVKLDGGMTVPARDRVIQAFRDDPHVTVFLISLKAGGVALNLTAASRIYLMDPWWNPAVEAQAMDRTHRLGQHRSISVVRFIVRNTVEEKIIALQEKKQLLFEGTVGQDTAALGKLGEDDMRFLFSS